MVFNGSYPGYGGLQKCVPMLLLLCTFAGANLSCTNQSGMTLPNLVDVTLKLSTEPSSEIVLIVELRNQSGRDLVIDADDLPWRFSSEAMTIALVEEDGLLRSPIGRTALIADGIVSPSVTIKAGERMDQKVSLDRYYHELPSRLQRHDVTMLWVFKPKIKNAPTAKPVVGYLRLAAC
jgi:hypothetical protein